MDEDLYKINEDILNEIMGKHVSDFIGTTATCPHNPPPLTLEMLNEVIKSVEAIMDTYPRPMTPNEFYKIHGQGGGVILSSEDIDKEMLKEYHLPEYVHISPFAPSGSVYLLSPNGNSEMGWILKEKLDMSKLYHSPQVSVRGVCLA